MKHIINSEMFRYILTGGVTTLINYLVFFGLTFLNINYLIANTIAWVVAVLFAFFANRALVFKSNGNILREFWNFVSLRLITLALENFLLFLFIDKLDIGSEISKISISFATIILNYVACKYGIFTKKGISHEKA